jgi:hypothetical protein
MVSEVFRKWRNMEDVDKTSRLSHYGLARGFAADWCLSATGRAALQDDPCRYRIVPMGSGRLKQLAR